MPILQGIHLVKELPEAHARIWRLLARNPNEPARYYIQINRDQADSFPYTIGEFISEHLWSTLPTEEAAAMLEAENYILWYQFRGRTPGRSTAEITGEDKDHENM